jgi:hypothetical protein
LFITYQITKTSLSFEKCVMVREILDTEKALWNHLARHTKGTTESPSQTHKGRYGVCRIVLQRRYGISSSGYCLDIRLVGRLSPVKEGSNGLLGVFWT